ncbi:hypothetical protein AB3S75_000875 [Citrus x aurantiifolia]
MDLIGPISEIFKCLCSPVCEYFEYYRKLDENMEKLDRVSRELESKKKDMKRHCRRRSVSKEKNQVMKSVIGCKTYEGSIPKQRVLNRRRRKETVSHVRVWEKMLRRRLKK